MLLVELLELLPLLALPHAAIRQPAATATSATGTRRPDPILMNLRFKTASFRKRSCSSAPAPE